LGKPFLEEYAADVASVRQLDIDERTAVGIILAARSNAIAADKQRGQPVARGGGQTPLVFTFGLEELRSVDGDEPPRLTVVAARVAVD
jgi:hypothetical protein